MGRHVGRSRACGICKKRKIKCDEQSPECSQCLRAGRQCPGPLEGILFIDVKENARTASGVRDNKPMEARKSHTTTNDPSTIDDHKVKQDQQYVGITSQAGALTTKHGVKFSPGDVSSQMALPSLYEPSRATLFQELFLESFIHTFFNPRTRFDKWADSLPEFLEKPRTKSITYAIRAATMSVYGKRSRDESIQMEACRCYAKGLESQLIEGQINQLQLSKGRSVTEVFSEETVCAPIMFCLFESAMCTSMAAWAQHLVAAGKMLEMLGPERCRHGIIHHMFRTVRIGIIYYGITWSRPSVFATEEWLTKPFLTYKKSPIDRVHDVLLHLPECLALRIKMLEARDRGLHTQQERYRQILEDKVPDLLLRLKVHWNEYKEDYDSDYDHSLYFELSNFVSLPKDWIISSTRDIVFQNVLAATMIPDYDAAVVIVSMILKDVQPERKMAHLQRMAIHCASILEAIRTHTNIGPHSGGDISLVFAMKSVYRCSPCKQQQDQVEFELERWGARRGVEGISRLWGNRLNEDFVQKVPHWDVPSRDGPICARVVDVS